jgi:C4-dicarboxylate-binding protein DctP
MITFWAKRSHRKHIVLILLLSTLYVGNLKSDPLPLIRISVENTAAHVQTKSVQQFKELLEEKLQGIYKVEFYSAASLFKDADIFRALAQGKVEIAVPGTWHFDTFVSEVGLFLLPSLYGRKASITYSLMESDVGTHIISSIENNIGVKVLGRFIDLGHTHIFSTRKAINTPKDFNNMKIRVAGGIGNSLRVEALGAQSITIPWPSLPLALRKRTIDGLLTSYETIVSAELYQFDIKYVYEDNEYFAQYVPIASRSFWEKLPLDIQHIILDSWDEIVDEARSNAQIAQENAKAIMMASDTTIITPSESTIKQTRETLLTKEASIAHQIGIPSHTYDLFSAFFANIDTPNYEYAK